MKTIHGFAVVACLSACAPEYAYEPTTNATATIHGNVAADYQIPANAPTGDVRIASFGMATISPPNDPNDTLRAIHLRVVLADNADPSWTFDTREQRIDLGDRGILAPAFATSNSGGQPPLVVVSKDGKRVVDLFFPVPAELQKEQSIPEFDVLWRVKTPAGTIAERTPFERLQIQPTTNELYGDQFDYGYGYPWGGPYWINSDIPYGYYGQHYPDGVVIQRAPFYVSPGSGGRGGSGSHGASSHSGGGHAGGGGGHR